MFHVLTTGWRNGEKKCVKDWESGKRGNKCRKISIFLVERQTKWSISKGI